MTERIHVVFAKDKICEMGATRVLILKRIKPPVFPFKNTKKVLELQIRHQKHKDFVRFENLCPYICSSYNLCVFFIVTGGKIITSVRLLDSISANHLPKLNNQHCGTVVFVEISEIAVVLLNGSFEGKVTLEWS